MQGIHKRGHLVVAGLIGGLLGVLVIALLPAPAATSSVPSLAAIHGGPDARQVQPGDWDTGVAMVVVPAPASGERDAGLNARQVLPGDMDTGVYVGRTPVWHERLEGLNA